MSFLITGGSHVSDADLPEAAAPVVLLERVNNAFIFSEQLTPSEIDYESGNAIGEICNTLTHAIAVGLAIASLVILLLLTGRNPSPWKYVGFSIYGASQILLFSSSALMHSFAALPQVRYNLRILDQVFVYVLIAGTYTPLCLVAMRGDWGWVVFGVVWGLAALGSFLKTCVYRERHILTDLLYLPMGWFVLVVIRPLIRATTPGLLLWMLIGGACYTAGMVFYAWKRMPFSHTIWHLSVVAGNVSFFLAYAMHLA